MPQDLPSPSATRPPEPRRGPFARLIDRYNPGVTFLVAVWVAGFACRQMLERRRLLAETIDDALISLLYVVPIMLVGWAVLALVQHLTGARFFDPGE